MKPELIPIIFTVLILFALTAVTFIFTTDNQNGIMKKLKKRLPFIACVGTGVSALLTLLDITNVLSCGGFKLLPMWCTIFGVMVILFMTFRKKIPEKFMNTTRFTARSFSVCMLLELLVFNLNSCHLSFHDYTKYTLDLTSATVENFDTSTNTNSVSGYSSIEFTGINVPVGTVTFEAESSKRGYVNFNISMKDETNSASYRGNIASAQVIRDNKRSETVPCNFSGAVSDIKFTFNSNDGEVITLNKIVLNSPIMLSFSLLRFLFFFLGSTFVYLLACSEFFKKSYGENRKGIRMASNLLLTVLILTSFWISYTSRSGGSILSDFKSTYGNQITQTIVDAFANGRVTIDTEMNQNLLNLENPYDWSQREAGQIGFHLWDHLLYEGEYYSYYGIGPVLTIFLPYYLITGYYFPSVWAVFLFGSFGMIFLAKFYLCFMDKFFKKTRSSLIFLGLVIMELSTGIWFCFSVPNFYEIAQSSGFLCTTAGAYYMIRSNVIGDGKIKNFSLALSAIFLSLAVLCRPTLAVYCVAALLFIFAGFRKKKSLYTKENGSKAKYYTPYFLSALLPFAIIGSIQMIYNYMRFSNPFDFGIQYSLTINDFTSAEYHTHFAVIGFFNYFLAIPNFRDTFPFFIQGDVQLFNPQGYYFIATYTAIGLLWKALPILAYGKTKTAYRISRDKNKKLYTLLIIAVCIICPFIIIASIWESGYGARYCVDFAWQVMIGAYIIAFIVFNRCNESMKKHLNKLMIVSAILCLALNFSQIYMWINPTEALSGDYQADMLSLGRLFEFWR